MLVGRIFLHNNEGSKISHASEVSTKMDRFQAKYGNGPFTDSMIDQAVRDGYRERWAAVFAAARDALIEPAWKKNVRFVSCNLLWDTAAIGSGSSRKPPLPGVWFDQEKGWLDWPLYDGAVPELYDNDWQPGKTDHTVRHPARRCGCAVRRSGNRRLPPAPAGIFAVPIGRSNGRS